MMKLDGVKKTTLTLSLYLFAASCQLQEFPDVPIYVLDLTEGVCAEYKLVDREKIKVDFVGEWGITPGSPCNGLTGFERRGFKDVQNWIRDAIELDKQK